MLRSKMRFPRGSGILLHPTSLPGRFPIGDLGPATFAFVDRLKAAGQTYWQILPLGPTGWGDSPYSAYSAFAGNTLLISPEKLVDVGLLTNDDTHAVSTERVDYGAAQELKESMLGLAFEQFKAGAANDLSAGFDAFCDENAWWLDDYALFSAIKETQDGRTWHEWSDPLKLRNADAIERSRLQLARRIDAEKFSQFLFFTQWFELRKYANGNGVHIIGDIPIFVALDSADVWCNRTEFKLNPDASPTVVAGVPPDYFSETGQLWGNPIYDWAAMGANNFNWWTARVAFNLRLFDIARLDHFIGFVRNWEVPAGDENAAGGEWAAVPGRELFATLKKRLGELPVIAEDLGAVTDEVIALRDACGFPGMKILHHAFNGDSFNADLPHNYGRNFVAYTGTHDNDTRVGWFASASKHERRFCRKYLQSRGREIHLDMVRAVESSVADIAIIPMQDVLGLGSDARMNLPATAGGNWQWRMRNGEFTDEIALRLGGLSELFGRCRK
jgi:4-alpha-glucanotransferase